MKIAIVAPVMVTVPPEKYGGIELIVDLLARGLGEHNHSITVFCAGGSKIEGKGITRVETSPYPTHEYLEKHRMWEEKQLRAVLDRQSEFDLIHFNYEPIVFRVAVNGEKINLLDRLTARAAFTFHNTTDIPAHIEYYHFHESLYRYTMIFLSDNQRSRVPFFPYAKVIHNGLPIADFPFEEIKENYLLFLGRITKVKGILEAIATAKKTSIPLVIAAKVDSVNKEFFDQEVSPLIDGSFIQYVGEVDFSHKVELLKKARCLLFPILWEEPFGLVIIEALACGTPVVAFRKGSVPEIIRDGVTGYVVETVEAMANAVKNVHHISPAKCRTDAEERFSSKRMVNEYERAFLEITN